MYDYSICTEPDEELFAKQCKALEKNIAGIEKVDYLEDVDGSQFQIYKKDGKKIVVKNSYYIGALFIESEIELTQFFPKPQDKAV